MGKRDPDLPWTAEESAAYRRDDLDVMESGRPMLDREETYYHADGARTVGLTSKIPLHDSAGRVIGVLGVSQDITERKAAEEALRASRQTLQTLIDSSPLVICVLDREANVVQWNPAAERTLGWTAAEVLGRPYPGVPPQARPYFLASRQKVLEGETINGLETKVLTKAGTLIDVSLSSAPLRDPDGGITRTMAVMQDITERKRWEVERERLLAEALERADRDPLSGLLNHRAFHKRLEEEADRALRGGTPLCVAVLDLNNFKFFNDAYGHLAGDDVLRQVADALRGVCRSYDTLARFGGDEFAVLMPGLTCAEAGAAAARLRERLAQVGYRPMGDASVIPIEASVGAAVFPDEAPTRLEVLELADSRLRRAKTGGGDEDNLIEPLENRLKKSVEGYAMLSALVAAVDNKDRYTRRHSEDVLTYSLMIARALGLDEATQHALAVAALLHDVGKIGVPDHVLRKPGRLTAEETAAMRQHPMMGAVIVGAVPGFEYTLDPIRHHHERWDGGGYPFGLRGKEIPLTARLMAVADAFSAMTTDRPYRKGIPESKARAILADGAGTQWDPACVEAFLAARRGLTSAACQI